MAKDKFNPTEWLSEPKQEIKTSTSKVIVPSTTYSPEQNDIETITQRIESSGTDITAGYQNWRDLGFALSDELGESGRDYFHRLSRFNPDYNSQEADKQYDKCLNAHGTGITIKTFFQMAKDAGISLRTGSSTKCADYAKSAKYAVRKLSDASPKCAEQDSAHIDNIAEVADMEEDEAMPTFSNLVKGQLPDLLEKIVDKAISDEDADILLLGSLTVLSACLPHISGVYADRTVYPNLFLFVTARASSGKGRLGLCRYLVEPIHDALREQNEAEEMEYKHKLAEYNAAGKKKVDMEKPEEPPMRMLFIPANSSATAVYQVLNDNGGEGLMFETEGDTLANTFSSDYGNYSDGFRKAFHHETISYIRRKDREYVNIKNPRLSTLLTGTPRQILNLITDAENGLFSRFIFYWLNMRLVWNNVFEHSGDLTLDEYFQSLGADFNDFYRVLKDNKDLHFSLTPEQQTDFNAHFEAWQAEYCESCGDEFVASVRRLGLMTFRIAMILSALRMMEDGNTEDDLICLDQDYTSAITIAEVLVSHISKVFLSLPKAATQSSTHKGEKTLLRQNFYDALPSEFDRKQYSEIATRIGLNPRTVDRTIHTWCDEGKLVKVSHGEYKKH